ncbi:MAG: zinc finger Ran-binding domain-containing protein [Candidatus Dependentiae bacterium]|nr:zinc finger Ran-binding domain-containing protein [Candidatus Dependentiae bacterium]
MKKVLITLLITSAALQTGTHLIAMNVQAEATVCCSVCTFENKYTSVNCEVCETSLAQVKKEINNAREERERKQLQAAIEASIALDLAKKQEEADLALALDFQKQEEKAAQDAASIAAIQALQEEDQKQEAADHPDHDASFALAMALEQEAQQLDWQPAQLDNTPLSPAELKTLNIIMLTPVRQAFGSATCGGHAVVNALLINKALEKGLPVSANLQGPEQKTQFSQATAYYKQQTKSKQQSMQNMQSGEIEHMAKHLGVHNVFVIDKDPTLMSLNTVTDRLKELSVNAGVAHFIFNTGGHWILFSVIKDNLDSLQLYYTDSIPKAYIPKVLHPYIRLVKNNFEHLSGPADAAAAEPAQAPGCILL